MSATSGTSSRLRGGGCQPPLRAGREMERSGEDSQTHFTNLKNLERLVGRTGQRKVFSEKNQTYQQCFNRRQL